MGLRPISRFPPKVISTYTAEKLPINGEQHMTGRWLKTLPWFGVVAAFAFGQSLPTHVVMTSQQDRQRVMDQLKITLFPSGPGAYLASTYDESTANPYPNLPDPLTFNDGSKVKTAAQWRPQRSCAPFTGRCFGELNWTTFVFSKKNTD